MSGEYQAGDFDSPAAARAAEARINGGEGYDPYEEGNTHRRGLKQQIGLPAGYI